MSTATCCPLADKKRRVRRRSLNLPRAKSRSQQQILVSTQRRNILFSTAAVLELRQWHHRHGIPCPPASVATNTTTTTTTTTTITSSPVSFSGNKWATARLTAQHKQRRRSLRCAAQAASNIIEQPNTQTSNFKLRTNERRTNDERRTTNDQRQTTTQLTHSLPPSLTHSLTHSQSVSHPQSPTVSHSPVVGAEHADTPAGVSRHLRHLPSSLCVSIQSKEANLSYIQRNTHRHPLPPDSANTTDRVTAATV